MAEKIKVSHDANDEVTFSVRDYHQRTKHSLEKYAAAPETLDWSLQPDAFRRFANCPKITLSLNADSISTSYAALYESDKIPPQSFSLANIASLFELSFGLSAWKQYGPDKWALRCNPSSGNLHPTEAYLVHPDNMLFRDELETGIYHYRSDDHLLEQRCNIKQELNILQVPQSESQQGFVIGLSSIHWREAWKYGERSYRYCQLDIGHAIATLSYAAATLGWHVKLLDNISDKDINTLLGLKQPDCFGKAERESPDALLYVSNTVSPDLATTSSVLKQLCEQLDETHWVGNANILDRHHMYKWPVIEQVSQAAEKPETIKQVKSFTATAPLSFSSESEEIKASQLIKQRRSAQAFDSKTILPLDTFYSILEKVLPGNAVPWNSIDLEPQIHLVFYIHRVEGLQPGLYAMPSYPDAKTLLQANMRDEFSWEKVASCPQHIPLYELVSAKCQNAARKLSCHQPIAGDSAFSVSMLAEYATALEKGDWYYRFLHWQAGIIGHILYLEAEAANVRGTGIGCFFDDAVHQTLGIENDTLQVVYHFTVGTPIVDQRIISLPPYTHLKR